MLLKAKLQMLKAYIKENIFLLIYAYFIDIFAFFENLTIQPIRSIQSVIEKGQKREDIRMTFVQKLRRVTLSMTVLVAIEAVAMIICYKLGVLRWFLAVLGACFIFEVAALTISDLKDKKNSINKMLD